MDSNLVLLHDLISNDVLWHSQGILPPLVTMCNFVSSNNESGTKNERTDYLCSGQQRGLIFTSKSNQITIYFSSESHEYLNAKGFWIRYEGIRSQKFKFATAMSSTNNKKNPCMHSKC